MQTVLQFSSTKELRAYIGTNEISQDGNENANARLFIVDETTVAKIYTRISQATKKNITNLRLIRNDLRLHDVRGLVLPNALLNLNGQIVGYTMDYIRGEQLRLAWHDSRIAPIQKFFWIAQLADTINQLPSGIYIGDLHAGNVLIDGHQNVNIIDVDGFSTKGGFMLSSPLANYSPVGLPKKYFDPLGNILVNKDSDIWCFFRLLFKLVMPEIDFFAFSTVYQEKYLDFLSSQGISDRFTGAIRAALSEKENSLPYGVIDAPVMSQVDFSYCSFLRHCSLINENQNAEKYLNEYINPRFYERSSADG